MSVYKSVQRKRQGLLPGVEDDSSVADSSGNDAEELAPQKASAVHSADLDNRVLMLTSRGVAHRFDCPLGLFLT